MRYISRRKFGKCVLSGMIAAGTVARSHASQGPIPKARGAVPGRLRVCSNHRYLEFENGKPFFYLGDTAWELFHRLNREEATHYLSNRAQKGFTVIQAVVLPQVGDLKSPMGTISARNFERMANLT